MNFKIVFPSFKEPNIQTIFLSPGDAMVMEGLNHKASDIFKSLFYGKPIKQVKLYVNNELVTPYLQVEKQLAAYMPPHFFTMPDSTVLENVQLWFNDYLNQDAILYEPLLQPIIHTKVGRISGGERRFLEVLLMLQLPHKLLLLDQPFTSIAPLSKERVMDKLRSILPNKAMLINDYHLVRDDLDFSR